MRFRELSVRRAAVGAACVALTLGLVACSQEEDPKTDPSPTASKSTSPSPSTSASESEPPLSKFEDEPQVKVVRSYLAAAAKAVNANDRELKTAAKLITPNGRSVLPQTMAEDFGLRYPGPIPFTPTRVQGESGRSTVLGCTVTEGFALDPKTKKPAKKRQVLAVSFPLVEVRGAWKVDGARSAGHSCRGVGVREVKW